MASKALACGIRFTVATLLFVSSILVISPVHATGQANNSPKSQSAACSTVDLGLDLSTDVQAIQSFDAVVAELFKQENFNELDCVADSLRLSKARFSGGASKLHIFYGGLSGPEGHATDEDWKEYLEHAQRWVAAKPKSITARIALANSYVNYAWYARGDSTSETVSGSGWKLFGQRLDKAKEILDQASSLEQKCPEWYAVMLTLALGQGWDVPQENALFERAIAFDPSYYQFYRDHALFLAPQWNGEEGESAQFAQTMADRVGGKAGDLLYFEIAIQLVCRCKDPQFAHMSWPRVQSGYAEVERKYGVSLTNLNDFALMAVKAQDSEVADGIFKRLGENWDKGTWGSEEFFTSNKKWAADIAPGEARFRRLREASEANMKSAEGQRFKKDFDLKLAKFMQPCVQDAGAGGDLNKFEMMIEVNKDGGVQNLGSNNMTTVAMCLFQNLMQTEKKKEKIFSKPPQPDYWMVLELDPSSFLVASK
jgi:Domain of unknown function (DUF4034)